jgi:hypothetical protein
MSASQQKLFNDEYKIAIQIRYKKKVGLDKLAECQMTAAYIVQTRFVLDNLEALQCEQCQ